MPTCFVERRDGKEKEREGGKEKKEEEREEGEMLKFCQLADPVRYNWQWSSISGFLEISIEEIILNFPKWILWKCYQRQQVNFYWIVLIIEML